ncbi:MAG: cation-transporting P-type ATPase, partial [Alsobacter sp.]
MNDGPKQPTPLVDPHSRPAVACFAALDASPDGLTGADAARRLAALGPNRLPEAHGRGPL